MTYNKENILLAIITDNPVIYRYYFNGTKWRRFELMRDITMDLGKCVCTINEGFKWDLSSVPSFLWWFMKPFGKFDIAYLQHDFLYQNKGVIEVDGSIYLFTRKECDQLMLEWCMAIVGTKKISLRNIDSYVRYYATRAFGWIVWIKKD